MRDNAYLDAIDVMLHIRLVRHLRMEGLDAIWWKGGSTHPINHIQMSLVII
jgi:hypothetical protein